MCILWLQSVQMPPLLQKKIRLLHTALEMVMACLSHLPASFLTPKLEVTAFILLILRSIPHHPVLCLLEALHLRFLQARPLPWHPALLAQHLDGSLLCRPDH